MLSNIAPKCSALEPLDVIVTGVRYGIVGITHDFVTRNIYLSMLAETMASRKNWLFEQGLKNYCRIKSGSEVADSAVPRSLDSFKDGIMLGLLSPLFPILIGYRALKSHDTVCNDQQELENSISQFKPPKKSYSTSTQRSGYMAQFMKAYKLGQEKNIVVGASHVPEIDYFLQHPIHDARIFDLASSHAELFEADPENFAQRKRYHQAARLVTMIGGGLVGLLPYIAGETIWDFRSGPT